MKHFWQKHYHRYMLRPILYRCFACLLGGTVLALLWRRFVDDSRSLSPAFFALAVVFGALGWFSYLAIDGVAAPLGKKRKQPRTEHSASGDLADYLDEEIVSFKDLGRTDRLWCHLAVNVSCFVLFLTASLLC